MAEEGKRVRARPESTIAQAFAQDLDSLFGLSPEMEKLSQTVDEKKQNVSSGEQQLQELEARLRETEKRLARVSRQSSPSRPAPPVPAGSGRNRPDIPDNATPKAPHPFAQRPQYPADRPPTAVAEQVPPERQQYSAANDYVMVEGGQAQRGYG